MSDFFETQFGIIDRGALALESGEFALIGRHILYSTDQSRLLNAAVLIEIVLCQTNFHISVLTQATSQIFDALTWRLAFANDGRRRSDPNVARTLNSTSAVFRHARVPAGIFRYSLQDVQGNVSEIIDGHETTPGDQRLIVEEPENFEIGYSMGDYREATFILMKHRKSQLLKRESAATFFS
uniref:Uncharacterized protein n=1 Tax=Romanomermis culicivorax TaxID=13658 RepID=A0A915JD54_ROMCU